MRRKRTFHNYFAAQVDIAVELVRHSQTQPMSDEESLKRPTNGQLGINANVADGGIRKCTRSDEIRPMIRRWPLPPLRPKRAASGVASLRYESGQRKTNHVLMSETSAGKPQPEAIPLNI
jgi:hypothetical protein